MMDFGLRNERFMDQVVRGIDDVIVYIDDILMVSPSPQQNKTYLRQLFSRLQEHGLRIHPSKCVLGVRELDFLGHRVCRRHLSIPSEGDGHHGVPLSKHAEETERLPRNGKLVLQVHP